MNTTAGSAKQMRQFPSRPRKDTPARLVAGALGGLAAAFAMNQFQALWTAAAKKTSVPQTKNPASKGDDATVLAASAISEQVFSHELSRAEKRWAGPAVHYALGSVLGMVYGAIAGSFPLARAGYGIAYGSIVWLAADEIAVPAFGLAKPPLDTSALSHAKALASHLVFGLVVDLTLRTIVKDKLIKGEMQAL